MYIVTVGSDQFGSMLHNLNKLSNGQLGNGLHQIVNH